MKDDSIRNDRKGESSRSQLRISQDFKDVLKDKRIIVYFVLGMLFLIITTGCALLFPSFAGKIIDKFFSDRVIDSSLMLILVIISLVSMSFGYFQTFTVSLMSERFAFLVRNRIYHKVIDMPEKYFIDNEKSKLLTVIMSDVNFVKEVFSQFANMFIMGLLMIIGSAVLMFSLNPRLALIIVVFIPLVFFIIMFLSKNMRLLFMDVQKERDKFNRIIDENVKASMLIRVFTSEKVEVDKFEHSNSKTLNLQKKIISRISLILPFVNFANFMGSLIIILIGGMFTINGTMTLGQVSAFGNYVMMFIMPLMMLSMMLNMIGQAFASISRIDDVLSSKNEFVDGTKHLDSIDSINVESLDFSIGEKKVLSGIDFHISKGEKVGIMGLTGSGKSLLVQLMLRLIEHDSGKILINGSDINEYAINTIRGRSGIVFQDNFLIDDTIDANIDFRRSLTAEEIASARAIAEVDEFYKNHPSDYRIGEQGKKLSGGQKQRIRIARAVAGKPDLIILDDCTSNLDVRTEKKIISNIRNSLKGISIIIISQKVASLSDCDRIYVLDNGKVTAVGKHDELLESSLLYKEIELTQKNRNSA